MTEQEKKQREESIRIRSEARNDIDYLKDYIRWLERELSRAFTCLKQMSE